MSCKLFCILILLFANSILVSSWEELLIFEEMTSPMIHTNVWQNINENTICMSRVTTISEKHNRHEYETQVYSGVRAARSLVFCVMFFGSLFVPLRFTASDYLFGIFNLFLCTWFYSRLFIVWTHLFAEIELKYHFKIFKIDGETWPHTF